MAAWSVAESANASISTISTTGDDDRTTIAGDTYRTQSTSVLGGRDTDSDLAYHSGQSDQSDQSDHSDQSDTEGDRSSTKSLGESIFDVVAENGRLYFNNTYQMPCDDAEQTRLSIIHQAYLLIMENGLHRADLSIIPLRRVLDLGCGPGDWAIEMGQRFPEAEFTAVDIGPFEIDPDDVPCNVQFLIDDAEDRWSYTESFDYIHIRGMSGAFSDWNFIYREAYRNLAPGGIIEVTDWSYTDLAGLESYDYVSIFGQAVTSASEISGYPRTSDHLRPSSLLAAGFQHIRKETISVPIGETSDSDPRQKTIGKMATIILLEGIEAQSLRLLTKYKNWSVEEVKDICEKVREELQQHKSELKLKLHVIIGQKPSPDDAEPESQSDLRLTPSQSHVSTGSSPYQDDGGTGKAKGKGKALGSRETLALSGHMLALTR